jgi:hypothetical protein
MRWWRGNSCARRAGLMRRSARPGSASAQKARASPAGAAGGSAEWGRAEAGRQRKIRCARSARPSPRGTLFCRHPSAVNLLPPSGSLARLCRLPRGADVALLPDDACRHTGRQDPGNLAWLGRKRRMPSSAALLRQVDTIEGSRGAGTSLRPGSVRGRRPRDVGAMTRVWGSRLGERKRRRRRCIVWLNSGVERGFAAGMPQGTSGKRRWLAADLPKRASECQLVCDACT